MNWEEFRYLSKMFTKSNAYNPDSPTTYGSGTHWWFAYAWSVGGDCIGWNGENYDFSVADKGANYLVLSETLELNDKTYYAGDIVSYLSGSRCGGGCARGQRSRIAFDLRCAL